MLVVHLGVDGPDTVITFTDNGPGIPAEVLPRVLEPFFTTKSPGVGTGLGLSLAYAIVHEEHGGRLEVDNAPEGGARVRVVLPTDGKPGARIPLFQPEDPKNLSGIGIPAIQLDGNA
jgi:signal transduction histidine kinase